MCPTDPLKLNRILCVSKARSIYDMDGHAFYMDMLPNGISGCTGNIAHNGYVLPSHTIQQTRLSCVWPTDNNNLHSFA